MLLRRHYTTPSTLSLVHSAEKLQLIRNPTPRSVVPSSTIFRSFNSNSPPQPTDKADPSDQPIIPQKIFRTDYRPPSFTIEHVDLSFQLGMNHTDVTACSRVLCVDDTADLILDGKNTLCQCMTL